MRLAMLLTVLSAVIWAEDAPKPPSKKKVAEAIPHVWISEGLVCAQATENRLDFATQSQPTSQGNFTNTALVQPHFHWNFGIQIDLGFQPKTQYYFASWCYLPNAANGSQSTDGAEGFFPVLSMDPHLSASSFVTSANLYWKLNTHLADGGTIFPWKPTDFFLLKTHVDVRIAALNQELKSAYGGGVFSRGTDVVTMYNDFLGIGPRVGIIPSFFLPAGFSLCGEFSAFSLVGRFYVKQEESYLSQTTFYRSHVNGGWTFGYDAKAYLGWQTEILYKAILLSGQIGWQWHEFFNQNRLLQNAFHLASGGDALFLQGGFLSLSVAF